MPLAHGSSRADFERNLKTELDAGKPRSQALAIAYSTQRAADGERAIRRERMEPLERSVRHVDVDGKLHVAISHISKAMVCPYYGREIPDSETLRLDPNEIYMLLRDPAELAAAASTANNLPLLDQHIAFSADDVPEENVVGSTGTDAVFNAPYLDNSLVIWTREAIDDVETRDKCELSCSYRYRADMQAGIFEGLHYDGIMRDIVFNHLALVPEGRAGPDVVVGDAKMTVSPLKSRRAILAQGALATTLRPILAADAKIDFGAVLKGVTAENFADKKPTILARLGRAVEGKTRVAFDAKHAESALDAVEAMDAEEDDDMGAADKKAADRRAKDRKAAMDAMCAADGEEESEEERAEREDRDKAEDARRAKDGEAEETEEERAERYSKDRKAAKDKKAKDAMKAKDEDPKPGPEGAKDRKAHDAALVARARKDTLKAIADAREATDLVRPHIGELTVAMDSAEEILRLALDGVDGIDLDGTESLSALKNIVRALPHPSASPKPALAFDAAANDAFSRRFPDARRIRHA